MEKLKSSKGREVTCDAIVEKLCKVWRATGSGKGIVIDPSETKMADPGYFSKDKICHYCKEKVHVRNDCSKLTQKQNGKMCKYPVPEPATKFP